MTAMAGRLSKCLAIWLTLTRSSTNAPAVLSKRTIPPAPFPDPNALVIEKGYAQQDVMAVLEQWKSQRVPYHDYLTSLPGDDEELWEHPHHIKSGGFTLNDQLMLTAYHDSDHLHQIVKIIRA